MTVHHVIDNDDFQRKLTEAGTKLVVVDFFATWCAPCNTMDSQLEELAKEFSNTLVALKLDVDECIEMAENYDVKKVPSFLIFKKGKKLEHIVGAAPNTLRTAIDKHI